MKSLNKAEMEPGQAADELVGLFSSICRVSRIAAVINNQVGFLLPSKQSLKAWFYTCSISFFVVLCILCIQTIISSLVLTMYRRTTKSETDIDCRSLCGQNDT